MHGRALHELPAFERLLQRQEAATRHLRRPLYGRAGLAHAARVLDVGCGSGAVTADLARATPGQVVGVDLDPRLLRRAHQGGLTVLRGDGARLPVPDGAFDVAACNLVLLWARDPAGVVAEMARAVRPGGTVLVAMEPDYGGKVHWPENPLIDLVFRGDGVRRRGGDPHAGRKLRAHMQAAGLRAEVGILNPELPTTEQDLATFQRERGLYRRLLAEAGFGAAAIDGWEREYLEALSAGVQLSYLPLFYAIGRKPVAGDVDRA